jgi:hypothetical protein
MNLDTILEGYLLKKIIFEQFGFFGATITASNQQANTRRETVDIIKYSTKFGSDLALDARTQIQKTTTNQSTSIKY